MADGPRVDKRSVAAMRWRVPPRDRVRSALTGERSRSTAVAGFTVALVFVVASLVLPVVDRAPIVDLVAPWWVFALLFAATAAFPIDLEVDGERHPCSFDAVPLVLGLALLTPGELVTAQAVGAALGLIVRRRSTRQLPFDVARLAFGTAVAIHVFGLLVDPADPLGPRTWLAVYAASLIADLTSALTQRAALAIATGERPTSTGVHVRAELSTLANASLGLVALVLMAREPAATWLAGLLALAMYASYRMSAGHQARERRLLALHAASRGLQEPLGREQVTRRALDEARALSGAEWAELIVLPAADGDPASRWRVSAGHGPAEPVPPHHVEILWRGLAMRGHAESLDSRTAPAGLRPALDAEGIRELAAAPLAVDGTTGLLVAANRIDGAGRWSADDVATLAAFAEHAAIALRTNGLLEDAATRAARTGPPTGHDRAESALGAAEPIMGVSAAA